MNLPESNQSNGASTLALLESAVSAPDQAMQDNPEIKEAFENSLRDLAQDILEFHPGLAHVLLGMGDTACPMVHGQN